MKRAMAALSCRRLESIAAIVALSFFLGGGPLAAMAQAGKDAKVFQILKNETQFSMFYEALLNTKEIWNVEGRTQINGSQLLLFAPTNAALTAALSNGVLPCLQSENGKAVFADFLMYLQFNVPISPRVTSVEDLLNVTKEGKIYSANGKAMSVAKVNGLISITGDDGQEALPIQKVIVTDPTVTLIPLEESVPVEAETGDKILSTCFGDDGSEPSTAPPTSRGPQSSGQSSAHASRSAPASRPARAPASSHSVPASSPGKRSRMLLY